MKTVYIGLEGSGKTFLMGSETERLIDRNAKLHKKVLGLWEEKKNVLKRHLSLLQKTGGDTSDVLLAIQELEKDIPKPRDIVSNIKYSPSLENYANSKGINIRYWKDIEELERFTECDLFIDEIGAYFDSRTFDLLPLSTRLWLAQAQKLGVHIWGGAQDWGQIDVSFRRLVGKIYEVKKLIGTRRPSKTMPAGKYRWAISLQWRLVPNANSDLADTRPMSIVPVPILMLHADMDRFDTNIRVSDTDPPPLKKIVQVC